MSPRRSVHENIFAGTVIRRGLGWPHREGGFRFLNPLEQNVSQLARVFVIQPQMRVFVHHLERVAKFYCCICASDLVHEIPFHSRVPIGIDAPRSIRTRAAPCGYSLFCKQPVPAPSANPCSSATYSSAALQAILSRLLMLRSCRHN